MSFHEAEPRFVVLVRNGNAKSWKFESGVRAFSPASFMIIARPALAAAPGVNNSNSREDASHVDRPNGIC
jgi:hypothetical protein